MVSSDGSHGVVGGLGDEQEWPPGFRFHPTDEELVLYYLKRKICRKKLKLNIIAEADVYKWDPEELPGLSILQTRDRQWFFFSPRDRKYPNGARSNRGTRHGYWKATGKDRTITNNSRSVGLKKTLVFYRGRAPNGVRTDWVMHEYTLDEEELKRCQNVQEYYALYKVYKKSGPGPKNGEQYGAPFREEDWNHDCPDFDNSANLEAKKVDEILLTDNIKVDDQVPAFTFEELIKNMSEDSLLELPELGDYAHTPSQVVSKDVENTMVDPAYKEIVVQEPANLFHVNGVQRNLEASFDLLPPAATQLQLQLHEAPEVASNPIVHEQEVYILPEEDFLEMEDLLGPVQPNQGNVEEPANNFQVEETDGLSELDLYHDAAMFLNDIGPGLDRIIDNYNFYFDSNPFGPGEVVDQPYVQGGGPIDNQLFPNDANQINYQYLSDGAAQAHEQEGSAITSAEFHPGSNSNQTSGVVYGSSNFTLQGDQNQSGNDDSRAASWFSSAIWSFVESIPTTPASAAENALVNRAFGRMSSFSRIKMNVGNSNISTGGDSETTKSSSRNRGFIFFPILVVGIAILWVVLGTVRIWGIGITT